MEYNLPHIKLNSNAGICPLCIKSAVFRFNHHSDITMSTMVSQITGISTVCSTVCPDAHQVKHQSCHWPLWGESTGERWVLLTKGQWRENGSIWWRYHVTESNEKTSQYMKLRWPWTMTQHSVILSLDALIPARDRSKQNWNNIFRYTYNTRGM